jgi:hypothetical protein
MRKLMSAIDSKAEMSSLLNACLLLTDADIISLTSVGLYDNV